MTWTYINGYHRGDHWLRVTSLHSETQSSQVPTRLYNINFQVKKKNYIFYDRGIGGIVSVQIFVNILFSTNDDTYAQKRQRWIRISVVNINKPSLRFKIKIHIIYTPFWCSLTFLRKCIFTNHKFVVGTSARQNDSVVILQYYNVVGRLLFKYAFRPIFFYIFYYCLRFYVIHVIRRFMIFSAIKRKHAQLPTQDKFVNYIII